jgi:ABC-type branched-subunit amino acid transport system ATPase component
LKILLPPKILDEIIDILLVEQKAEIALEIADHATIIEWARSSIGERPRKRGRQIFDSSVCKL